MHDASQPIGYSAAPARAYTRLVVSVLAPPCLVLSGMMINYIINDQICRNGWSRALLHPTFLVVLVIIAWLGRYALRFWPDQPFATSEDSSRSVDRFTGLLGVGSAALFALITLAQWLAAVMIRPCQ